MIDNTHIGRGPVEQRPGQPDPTSQDYIDYTRDQGAKLAVGSVVATTPAFPRHLVAIFGPHRAWIKGGDDWWSATASDDAFNDYDIGDLIASGAAEVVREGASTPAPSSQTHANTSHSAKSAASIIEHPTDTYTKDGVETCEGCDEAVGRCTCVCTVCEDAIADCACPDGPTL